MFALAAVAAGSAISPCLIAKQTLAEALDSIEGSAGDTNMLNTRRLGQTFDPLRSEPEPQTDVGRNLVAPVLEGVEASAFRRH